MVNSPTLSIALSNEMPVNKTKPEPQNVTNNNVLPTNEKYGIRELLNTSPKIPPAEK